MAEHLVNSLALIAERIRARHSRSPRTRAYLIGTGPGDLDYLTIKAISAIAACDVLLVDELVNHQILQFARPDSEIISVGKKAGRHSVPQEQIEELFLDKLKRGKIVGRLKGGDPFVFGRGGEELLMLFKNQIVFETISGITAGIAAPAALGIPVTHRGLAQSATFVTGHTCHSAELPRWRALVASQSTLIIYMGMTRIKDICRTLQECGMPASTPAAAVANGSLPSQQSVITTLGNLAEVIKAEGLVAPAIVIIGAVVAIGEKLLEQSVELLPVDYREAILEQEVSAEVVAKVNSVIPAHPSFELG
ncbi:MAG: uroporphyrinogen-III C-methyltransferase [Candidatus Melainabacteria bacterium]|nr:uroporphyrinogen-III C-methyltransferase [Candidatus Melainabacteria bacterium]